MMIVTGHQPNYLPYPGFFEKIARADLFIIVDNVQFVKRGPFGWIHRNKVRTEKGWDWLTVPVLTKGKFTQSIRETRINGAQPWARKHWRTIEWNYRKAPHFGKYADGLRTIFDRKWEWIWELNVELIHLIMGWLEIKTPVKIASEMGVEGQAT
ncbi:MAG: WbqC family protein, partial [Acidobacteria bacterium]|nr:WbqC family protein [Acidobacteriota bacterium]